LGTVRDKRIVTLVYTDMEGSTRLLGSLRDAFLPVLERQRVILGAATAAHGGAGYATGGDGCVFLFGSPSSAVAAAVEAQRALAVERWPAGVSVRVRMAIHAGEVADLGDELFGMALHHVSRMLGVTQGGQVLLSGAAVGLITEIPPGIALRDLGPHRLRDVVRPVQLHQAVAEGIPDSFPPVPAAMSRSGTLPAATTSFVGRERQLQELVDLLAVRRLVTLTGVGGSGKTRLALEVARRLQGSHRDGVCLVELAGLGNAALVPGAVLEAVGMREPPAGTSATEALCAALAERALLLVLDNCEHVVAGVAALVSELLRACAKLHVLATSREPLRLPGEVERPVPPLDRSLALGWTSGKIQSAQGTGIQPFATLVSAGWDEHRVAGRSLSLERAADLALRVLDEELAAASAVEGREGGGAAGIADTPRRQGP
jgi:class 3 adenylate cyclase